MHPCCALLFVGPRRILRRLSLLSVSWQRTKHIKEASNMHQQRVSSSSSPQGAHGPIPSRQDTLAISSRIVVLISGNVRPVKPARIIHSFQDQADRAILAPTSPAEAGRSDPGRRVDGSSDQTRRDIEICFSAGGVAEHTLSVRGDAEHAASYGLRLIRKTT